ncbi:hypothetical protein ABZP36_033617 [Zizania latifolia]
MKLLQAASTVKRNRSRCEHIKRDAETIGELLGELKDDMEEEEEKLATTAGKATRSLLERLEKAINTGLELVESCGKRSCLNLFFDGQGLAGKLEDVREEISCCARAFKLARIVKQLEGIHRVLRSNSAVCI